MDKITWLGTLGHPTHGLPSGFAWRERIMERLAEGRPADGVASRNGMLASGPFPLPAGAMAARDVPYGSDAAQTLDVYRPANAEGAPIIFMVHGGGWARGDKGLWRSVRNKVLHWVERGFVLVSVNYRMLPEALPVDQADDVAAALAFVQANAESLGGDPTRVLLIGHSSGGHLVSLIAADPTIAQRAGATPWLGAISIDSAAFDVVDIMRRGHLGLYDRAFGDDIADWRAASPTHRMTTGLSAPFLAVCSSLREDSCAQANAFAAKAESMGGRATVLPVDLSHGDLNDLLGAPGAYTENVDAFIGSLGLLPAPSPTAP